MNREETEQHNKEKAEVFKNSCDKMNARLICGIAVKENNEMLLVTTDNVTPTEIIGLMREMVQTFDSISKQAKIDRSQLN